MLGTIMFISKIIMEALPNIHLISLLTIVYTLVFRWRALVPIYCFVFLCGVYGGFATWWVPYLYVWTVLWAVVMILPKNMPKWLLAIVLPAICSAHGFLFGVIYAPVYSLLMRFDLTQMLAWIAAGFYMDMIHGISNIFTGMMALPIASRLKKIVSKVI